MWRAKSGQGLPSSSLPVEFRDGVASELERIAASHGFQRSDILTRLLFFLVEETLVGRGSELTQVRIASEILGDHHDFDPRRDARVRVEVSRLRKRLEAYYAGAEATGRVRIKLPAGQYVPTFEANIVPPDTAPPPAAGKRGRRTAFVLMAAALLAVVAFTFPRWFEPGREAPVSHVAVARFLDITPHPDGLLARGFATELARALSRSGSIKVVETEIDYPTGYGSKSKPAGPGTRAGSILRGTLQVVEGKLRVQVHLTTIDGHPMFAVHLETELGNWREAHNRIVQGVVKAIQEWPHSPGPG